MSLLWRCSDTGADGPDGFVSEDDLGPVSDAVFAGIKLSLEDSVGGSVVPLLELLADAKNHVHALGHGVLDLGSNLLVALSVLHASLAMSENDP